MTAIPTNTMRCASMGDIPRANLKVYASFSRAKSIREIGAAVGSRLSDFTQNFAVENFETAAKMLQRIDHLSVKLALASAVDEAELALKDAMLDRALHRDHGWLNESARAIVVDLRAVDAAPARDPTHVFNGHAMRQTAVIDFIEWAKSEDGLSAKRGVQAERVAQLSELIGLMEEASEHLEVLLEADDDRMTGCHVYAFDLLTLLCITPTHTKGESALKTAYLQVQRSVAYDRDPHTYLMLNATIDYERRRWTVGSPFERSPPSVH